MPFEEDEARSAKMTAEKTNAAAYGDCCPATGSSIGYTRDYVIDELFTYHSPSLEQQRQMQTIRETGKFLAKTILANTPPGSDQRAAIDKLRECVMKANAAVVLNGISL